MQLKISPLVGPRYWAAIAIASICGANLGDVFPDIFRIGSLIGLLILTAGFVIIFALDDLSKRGSEVFYWAAILVVRAAATEISDFVIGPSHKGYMLVAVLLTIALLILTHLPRRSNRTPPAVRFGDADAEFWVTMLVAGALGTIIGDGVAHAFQSITTGVPVSAAIATTAAISLLFLRSKGLVSVIMSYWMTIVAIRTWGTNVGDIFAFVFSLPISLLASALILTGILLIWPQSKCHSEIGTFGC